MKRFLIAVAMMLACAAGANAAQAGLNSAKPVEKSTEAGELSVKEPYSDGMVLQQCAEALVCGHAAPQANVTVVTSWNKKKYTAETDQAGVWRVKVDTPKASYDHHRIDISCGSQKLAIADVLVGEVWIAAGQSNMEMPVGGFRNCPVEGAMHTICNPAAEDHVRMFTVIPVASEEPVSDVIETRGWEKSSQATVGNMSAVAYYFAEQLNKVLDIPVGIVALPKGGTRVEGWLPKEIVAGYGTEDLSAQAFAQMKEWRRPYMFYNAMQQPVKGYTAKGFIWYQGCSNVHSFETYADRLKQMIALWRSEWGDNDASMPFYQVQVAPYVYVGPEKGKGAFLREAQSQVAREVPNCAIVGTTDLVSDYEKANIHPCRKKPIGERLAYLALNRDYGYKTIACVCPCADRAFRSDEDPSMIYVHVSGCESGVDRRVDLMGLEIAGEDAVFVPATNIRYSVSKSALEIKGGYVSKPMYVRYCWADYCPGNIHNCYGLPLMPFNLVVK